VIEILDAYFIYLKDVKNRSDDTIQGYTKDLRAFDAFLHFDENRKVSLEEITEKDVLNFLETGKKGKKASPAHRNRRLSAIQMFFQYCQKENLIKSNPASAIDHIRINYQEPDFLTFEDYQKFINHIEQKSIPDFYKIRDVAIIAVLYNTGLRLHELVGLDIESIDFERKEFRNIKRKGGRRVNLVVNGEVLKRIKIWLTYRKKQPLGTGDPALFLSHQNQRIHQRSVQSMISKYVDECQFSKRITTHTFRHSFCTEIQMRGSPISIAKELMDHYSITTTARYSHATEDAKRKAVESLTKQKKQPS
jgi:integrase/recombinase XerC